MRLAWLWCALSGCWLGSATVDQKIADLPGSEPEADDTDSQPDTEVDPPADDSDTPTVEESDTPPEETDTEPPQPVCWDELIPNGASGLDLIGSTLDGGDDLDGTCTAYEGGLDLAWGWTVPTTGCYVFGTLGSSFDTVLYLLDGCGQEIVCNDDADREIGQYSSEIHAHLNEGQEVTVVVDGFDNSEAGEVALSFYLGEPVPTDIDASFVEGELTTASTVGADTTISFVPFGDCQAESGRDQIIRWQSPLAGLWRFSIREADFDTVLSLHRECDDFAMRCVDVPRPWFGGEQEALEITLDAMEVVLLRVAGARFLGSYGTGTFTLDAEWVEE
jgi:hypothetical protein